MFGLSPLRLPFRHTRIDGSPIIVRSVFLVFFAFLLSISFFLSALPSLLRLLTAETNLPKKAPF